MSWDLPSSFRREFKTSISDQLHVQTKFQEVKNFGQSKIVGITKKYGMRAKDSICHKSDQREF